VANRVSGPGIVEILHGHRPVARGKFLYSGDRKLCVQGVTYGTFRQGEDGSCYPSAEVVAEDFAMMVQHGVNAVRTYTAPPRWLLDLAAEHGLHVIVGLAWEQHIAFLDDRDRLRLIEKRVRSDARACSGHPALLCFVVGNEIPASIVRWYGKRRVERFIERLYRAAKDADPQALVTYANYPSTEYLELPFLDLACFNVFLEHPRELEAYVARLHNVVGDRPLLLTELGLDSRQHGLDEQAESVESQLRTAFQGGCAGAVVFSWTDEWHRGGHDVDDWDFGLTDRLRRAKPSLDAASHAFAGVPYMHDRPRITVAVCTYNGSATLHACLEGIRNLDYPNFETIVVDDGSTDSSAAIAQEYEVRVIRTDNRGLASARNTALAEAEGEIVAYLDDDASPDSDWLRYLAATFEDPGLGGVGGPNIPPEGEGLVAECVAHSPGGPQHVLISDTEAEHIPGCNMAFRREALRSVGGFDPQFHVAGDDVDICWQLQEHGWKLGFSPAAVVWHRRRATIRGYLKQQAGYGRAEALLERKWPEKYNSGGHVSWGGRVYANGLSRLGRFRIYYGTWGSSPFQSIYERSPRTLGSLPLMPEWYLLVAILAVASFYELWRGPVGISVPPFDVPVSLVLLALAVSVLVVRVAGGASRCFTGGASRRATLARRLVAAYLWLVQPLARLWGRLHYGLTPWRRPALGRFAVPWPRSGMVWRETWRSQSDRLLALEQDLRLRNIGVWPGPADDRWDLQVRAGGLGFVRLRLAIEEHGEGRQLIRYRLWPRWSVAGLVIGATLGALCVLMAFEHRPFELTVLLVLIALLIVRTIVDLGSATGAILFALERHEQQQPLDLVDALAEQLPKQAPVKIRAPLSGLERAATVQEREQ
jgi:GT2 family glycosyltransferase